MQLRWETLGAVSRRVSTAELMDDPNVDEAELAENFREIEETNRRFGGITPVLREVLARQGVRLLDVGCGSADIPRALLREARRRGRRLEIVALDRSAAVLSIARRLAGDEPFLRFVRADGAALPFPDASFDFVTCNLALHHFDPPAALELLRELRRVARVAPLVCDLRRSYAGYIATQLYVRLFCSNRLTRHDAPLSVRRAYTPAEALDLAERAGWTRPRVRECRFFRMVLCDG